MKYSIVIPVYNSSESLIELHQRIKYVFDQLNETFELVFVDDGSSNPNTWKTIESLSSVHPFVNGIALSQNYGKSTALFCGLEYAQGEWIITMDDDLQHAPESIPLLIHASTNVDVVMGYFKTPKHSFLKSILSRLKTHILQTSLPNANQLQPSPFKLIHRTILHKALYQIKGPFLFSGRLTAATKNIASIQVYHQVRKHGKSNFGLKASFKYVLLWLQFLLRIGKNPSYLIKDQVR